VCVSDTVCVVPCSLSVHPTQPSLFVSGGCDTLAKVWDVRVRKCVQTFAGHENDINSVQYGHTDPVYAAPSRHELTVNCNARTHTHTNTHTHVVRARFLPSGDGFGTASDDSTCRIFDLRSDRELVVCADDAVSCGVTYAAAPPSTTTERERGGERHTHALVLWCLTVWVRRTA
jgi:guanine nucleotide-binding protein G(I)/G(S)/G(T) subunit beta-1